ncbi:MAG: transglutaminase domain-containing protein [Lachnospiraceae bacterium]|nr:transglutaminase domain-containing protein [Lachnospiraceae bacterium]
MKSKILFCKITTAYLLAAMCFSGCGSTNTTAVTSVDTNQPQETDETFEISTTKGSRDNAIQALEVLADGTEVYSCDVAVIDASHKNEGYLCVKYTGTCQKVKLQISGSTGGTYTYNLLGSEFESFPLSVGSDTYKVAVYENIADSQYSTAFSEDIDVTIENEFGPFLYPNQYVSFTADSETVTLGADLAYSANSDLDVVSNVYNYVVHNISYDHDKANTVASGYTADVDEILEKGNGICLDYAAVMATMLRSQRIPTKLDVGYAGTEYHAWVSTYIDDVGWVDGIIQFDGQNWQMMDPTFAANTDEKAFEEFFKDSTNYNVKYVY